MIKPNLTCKLLAKQAVQVWLGFIILNWVKAPTVHTLLGVTTCLTLDLGPLRALPPLMNYIVTIYSARAFQWRIVYQNRFGVAILPVFHIFNILFLGRSTTVLPYPVFKTQAPSEPFSSNSISTVFSKVKRRNYWKLKIVTCIIACDVTIDHCLRWKLRSDERSGNNNHGLEPDIGNHQKGKCIINY